MTVDAQSHDRPRQTPRGISWHPLILIAGLLVSFGIAYKLLTQVPATPLESWPDRVAKAIDAGELDEARRILSDVRRDAPQDHQALLTMAVVEGLGGDYEQALRSVEQHREHFDDPTLTFYAAKFSLNLDDLGKSLKYLTRTLELRPNHLEARRLLANLEANLMRPNAARRHLAVLDSYGAAGVEDVCLFCAGDRSRFDLDENIKHLEGMRARDETNPLIIYALASNYWRLNRIDKARRMLESLSEQWHSLGHDEAWRIPLGLAELAVDDGQHAVALRWLSELPEQANGSYRVWLARGRSHRALNQPQRAIISFRNAAAMDPYNPEPVYVLSQLLDQDSPEEAGRLRERATRLQTLNVLVESTLRLESMDAAAERIVMIGEKFAELDLKREALICFRWLDEQGYSFQQIPRYLSALESHALSTPLMFRVPDPADLDPLPADSAEPRSVAPSADFGIGGLAFRELEIASVVTFEYDCSGDTEKTLLTSLGGGVAALDFDRDGFDDLFFPQGGPLPNAPDRTGDVDELFRAAPDGPYLNVTDSAGIHGGDYGHGAEVGDFDNDGFPDLFVTNYGRNVLFRNNGDGTFDDVTAIAGITGDDWSVSAAFADFDNDGSLDLYVVNYLDVRVEGMVPCTDGKDTPCGPLHLPAQQDRVWLNDGRGGFTEVTGQSGIVVPHGKGLGVLAAHLNDDDRIDLFVSNDTTANLLFLGEPVNEQDRDQGRRFHFREAATLMGVAVGGDGTAEACMGIACGDIDGDLQFDLFVTNFEGETNTLYMNAGDGMFSDRTDAYRLGNPSYSLMGWGTQFVDIDSDGDLDLFVANGHLHQGRMRPQLFVQTEEGHFREPSADIGAYFSKQHLGRGAMVIDYNRDLRPDLLVTHREGAPVVLVNESESGNGLELRLSGVQSNRDAVGARIYVRTGDRVQARQIFGGGGYVTSRQPAVFVGVGESQTIDSLSVIWPGGRRQEWNNVATGQRLLLTEEGSLFTLPAGPAP